jgi:hypothetical protein
MKTTSLFETLAMCCTVAALVGCASTSRQVPESSLDENQQLPEEAAAATRPPRPVISEERAFRELDVDRDQAVTWDEWRQVDRNAGAKDAFTALDESGDGQVSLTESLSGRTHQQPDPDADGTVTLNQWLRFERSEIGRAHV